MKKPLFIFKYILSSIVLFSLIIVLINIIYPSPSWTDICFGACNSDEQIIFANKDITYRSYVKNIFTFIAMGFLFLLILSVYIFDKLKKYKLFFLIMFLLSFLYASFSKVSYFIFSYG